MAWNKYKCQNCGLDHDFVGSRKDRPCPGCGSSNKPLMPQAVNSPSVMETVDKARNVKWRENLQERAQKRAAAHLKHDGTERSRVHGDDKRKHGMTEDDPQLR